jgi:ABC-type microcin C transport system duplicated ATPase subunit YejF
MSQPLLELTGLVKVYKRSGAEFTAVDHVDLVVHAGETVGLIGESGSGKSTIGRMALMLIAPDGGSVKFLGEELTTAAPERIRRLRTELQVVFQEPYESLNPYMTVREAIAEPLVIARPRVPRAEIDQRVIAAARRVGLGDLVDRYPAQLSGGQQQRVGVARAIVVRPKLIVLDEPTSSLDLSVRAEILDLLAELQDELGVAYLFISHDLGTIEGTADRIVVLRGGKIVEEGTVDDIFDAPREDYTRDLLAARLEVVRAE